MRSIWSSGPSLTLFLVCAVWSSVSFGSDRPSRDWVSLWPLNVPWNITCGWFVEDSGVDVVQERGGVGGLVSSMGGRYDFIKGR